MILYFGGAFNGKLEFVKKQFNLEDRDIHYCGDCDIDFSKKVISGIDRFIYFRTLRGETAVDYFKKNIEKFKDKIIICDNISEGVVPIKREERIWREEVGQVMQCLVEKSARVSKIYFGLEKRLKG